MTFWSDPARLFPKQSHRWVIRFGQHRGDTNYYRGNSNTISSFFAKSVEKPSFDIKTTQVKYMHSHAFNFPQRVIWNPITITLYDVTKRRASYVKKTITQKVERKRSKIIEEKIEYPQTAKPGTSIIEDPNTGLDTLRQIVNPILNKDAVDVYSFNSVVDKDGNLLLADKSTQLFFYRFLQESGYFIPEELDRQDYLMRFRDYNFKNNMIASLVGESSYSKENSLNYKDPLTKKEFINTQKWQTIEIIELDEDGNPTETWQIYNPLITSVKSDKLDYTNEGVLNLTIGITYDWAKLVPAFTEKHLIVSETERKTEIVKPKETPEVDLNLLSKKESVKKMLELKSTFAKGLKEGAIDKKYLEDIAARKNASALTKEAASSALEELNFSKLQEEAAKKAEEERRYQAPNFTPQGLQNQPEANPQVPKVREVPSTSPEPKVSPSETTIINVTGPGSDPSITETRTIPLEGAGRGFNRSSNSVTSFSISANDPSLESNKNYSPSNDPLLREMFEDLYPYQEPTPQPTPQQAPKQDATRRDAEVERALNRSEQAANLAELRGSG